MRCTIMATSILLSFVQTGFACEEGDTKCDGTSRLSCICYNSGRDCAWRSIGQCSSYNNDKNQASYILKIKKDLLSTHD